MNGQDHAKENGKIRSAINPGGLLHIARSGQEHLTEKKNGERCHQGIGRRHALKGVQPAQIMDQDKVGNKKNGGGNHGRGNEKKKQQITSWEPQPGKSISSGRTEEDLRDHGHGREDRAVKQSPEKSNLCQPGLGQSRIVWINETQNPLKIEEGGILGQDRVPTGKQSIRTGQGRFKGDPKRAEGNDSKDDQNGITQPATDRQRRFGTFHEITPGPILPNEARASEPK